MKQFDYRQDITLLRVTIDGLLNTFQDERLQVWMNPSKSGQRLTRVEFGEGDQTLQKFVPPTMQEAELGKVQFTAKEHRLSAYVFCQTRDIKETMALLKGKMTEELESRRIRFDNVQKHLDLWL